LFRRVKRALTDVVTRRDMFNGNRQTLKLAFWGRESLVGFTITSYFKRRREWPEGIGAPPTLEVVRLRSPAAVERWLRCQARD
jgi:hypothetical protein